MNPPIKCSQLTRCIKLRQASGATESAAIPPAPPPPFPLTKQDRRIPLMRDERPGGPSPSPELTTHAWVYEWVNVGVLTYACPWVYNTNLKC